MTVVLPRRRFIQGLIGLVAAPAIVKITSIMPVKSWVELPPIDYGIWQPVWNSSEGRFVMAKVLDIPIQQFSGVELDREQVAILAEVERALGVIIDQDIRSIHAWKHQVVDVATDFHVS